MEELSVDTIESAKQQAIAELKFAKYKYEKRSITVEIRGKKYSFFGGSIALDKYSKAEDLAKRKNLSKGSVATSNRAIWVEVGASDMDNIIKAIATQNYRAERKYGYYLEAINKASSIEGARAIVWEDVRS